MDMDNELEQLVLIDEDGNQSTMDVVAEFEVEKFGKAYVVLGVPEQDPLDGEYYYDQLWVFAVVGEREDGDYLLSTVDDEDEFSAIEEIIAEMMADADEAGPVN